VAQTLDEQADRGLLPGLNARAWLNAFFDPRKDYAPPASEQTVPELAAGDDESIWIRESKEGIQLRRHPETELGRRPWLWSIVSRFRSCAARELRQQEIETWSAFDVECWSIMVCAEQREVMRQLEKKNKQAKPGEVSGG
jgi:hypothetical protein